MDTFFLQLTRIILWMRGSHAWPPAAKPVRLIYEGAGMTCFTVFKPFRHQIIICVDMKLCLITHDHDDALGPSAWFGNLLSAVCDLGGSICATSRGLCAYYLINGRF